MKGSSEKRYLANLWNDMVIHFKSFVKTSDQEELHKFRVAVKKISSFLTLIQGCNHDDRILKSFKPILKIFKQAGAIRDAYLNIQVSAQYQFKTPHFKNQQQQLLAANINQLKKHSQRNLKAFSKAHAHVLHHVDDIENEDIVVFYYRQLYQIAHILAEKNFNEQLHACRKKIKHLLYNHKVIGKKNTSEIGLNTSYLDQLQSFIGNWHDKLMLANLLSTRLTDGSELQRLTIQCNESQRAILSCSDVFWTRALQ